MLSNSKKFIVLIAISTCLSAFSLLSILNFTDPSNANQLIFAFFYTSLFLFSFGIFGIIGISLRLWLIPGLYIVNLSNSLRQAALISVLITVSFLLLSHRLLFWWLEATLIFLVLFIEAFLNLKI